MTDGQTLYVCGLVAYDGTGYNGFQSQVGVPTVQDALESGLAACAQMDGRVVGAGRTDAGVHAAGQVVAAKVIWRHSVASLQRAWNAHLAPSLAIRKLQEAPLGFHPRFSATARTYRYTVYDRTPQAHFARDRHAPLQERFALFVPQQLDLQSMQAATEYLIGRHDFAAFGQPPQGENTERHVMVATWEIVESSLAALQQPADRHLVFTIRADAFLRQMVRNIVGTLLDVGRGRKTPPQVNEVLLSRNRSLCSPPAPPQGLVLERVEYPSEFRLRL